MSELSKQSAYDIGRAFGRSFVKARCRTKGDLAAEFPPSLHLDRYILSPSSDLPVNTQQVMEAGYQKLLDRMGRTFVDFLVNLNNLHLHLGLGWPTMQPPDFRVANVTSSSLELHYRSKRPGLKSWVRGAPRGRRETVSLVVGH